jgi:hypothetical protein
MWVTSDLLGGCLRARGEDRREVRKAGSWLINKAERRHRAAIDLSSAVANTAAQLMRAAVVTLVT